jgi:hypothetical protein
MTARRARGRSGAGTTANAHGPTPPANGPHSAANGRTLSEYR